MLEAPVTGSKTGAEKGTLILMTGGPRALHDELLPVMMAIGRRPFTAARWARARS
jgi:3-hydroxyisobutyrate dehydrogenase-like beta-hydroxyacid dehydrogenase